MAVYIRLGCFDVGVTGSDYQSSDASICQYLAFAMFGRTQYSLDETRIVKCVFKARCVVIARMNITRQMSIDLPHIDCRAHEPTGDHALVGYCEWNVRGQLDVTGLNAVGVITG
jgi:hypothetical protein